MELAEIKSRLRSQHIGTPSWGYADSGTRFHVYHRPWSPRNLEETLQRALAEIAELFDTQTAILLATEEGNVEQKKVAGDWGSILVISARKSRFLSSRGDRCRWFPRDPCCNDMRWITFPWPARNSRSLAIEYSSSIPRLAMRKPSWSPSRVNGSSFWRAR